jgi:hypothetical protein
MALSWYLKRLRTFSAGEIFYRIRQRIRTHVLDWIKLDDSDYTHEKPDCPIVLDSNAHCFYPIFESSVDIFKDIDWHLDVSTGRRFPRTFSHAIDIRSDKYGSAKHVWEVNRMQFLLHIAWLFKTTGQQKYLVLFCHHLGMWKDANPYLVGVNWYSNIEVNLRLICWFFCWDLLDIDGLRKENPIVDSFVAEIWNYLIRDHACFSYKHPSFYSSANNHLIAEYAGLFIAACKWNIPHRNSRLKYAQKGLEREILKQNTSEGVNREEAAEYIQFIDDFFLIAAVVGDATGHPFSAAYKDRLHAMAHYMDAMLDMNCNYPMYGDGDDGFVLRPDAGGHFNNFKSLLVSFATYFGDSSFKREGLAWDEKNEILLGKEGHEKFDALPVAPISSLDGNRFFAESGHFVFRKAERADAGAVARETYMHFDAAPLGYLSIAAHGHADALSFILHVDGNPVIVDPGTFTYHTHKDLRRYFVSTLAHNTVCVNGKNQAEQAGPTMWLKHYKVNVVSNDETQGFVEATHNGYESEGVSHKRRVEFNRDTEEFVITDILRCGRKSSLEIPFHLHPSATVNLNGSVAEISVPGSRRVVMEFDDKRSYEIREDGWYSEHFGEKVPARYLYAKVDCEGTAEFMTKIRIR